MQSIKKDSISPKTEFLFLKTEEQFNTLIETIPSVIYITDVDDNFTCRYVSQNLYEVTGFEPAEMIGSSSFWYERIHPDDRKKVLRQLPKNWSDVNCTLEYRIRTKNGTYRWIHDRFRTNKHSIFGNNEIIGTWTDITDRKKVEEKFHGLLEAAPDAIIIINRQGKIVFINNQAERLFGYSQEELIDKQIEILVPEKFRDKHFDHRKNYSSNPHVRPMKPGLNICGLHKDGHEFPVEISLSPIETDEGMLISSSIRDITERVQAEKDLRKLNDRLRLLLDSSSEGIFGINRSGYCTFINKVGARMLGYRIDDLIGKDMFEVTHLGDEGSIYPREDCPMIAACRDGQGRRAYDEVFWLKNGKTMAVQYSAFPIFDGNDINGSIITFSDITEKKLADKRLDYIVNYDSLTDLPNRNQFHDQLDSAIKKAKDGGDSIATLFFDLDSFKDINDSLGHNAGDHLLRELADRINHKLDDSQLLARVGGDEFALFAIDIGNPEEAAELARKLITYLRKPFVIKGKEVFVRICIGISIFPDDGEDIQTILINADTAMSNAKKEGSNIFKFYKSDMNADKIQSLELDTELRYALERQELELFYQPQANINTGEICGFEALLRWNHKERGLISPMHFIPLLEETGLIIEVGEWTIWQACDQLSKWHRSFDKELTMSVNLSGQQFKTADLINPVHRIIQQTQLLPSHLELEVTETILMEHFQTVISTINTLTAKGVNFSIDDFGTGYSSLAYLKSFPVQKLKIDRAFVRDMHANQDDESICAAIVSLGHSLGLKVIAEGVENESQLEKLRLMKCDQIQGYFLSKPLPVEEVTVFLKDRTEVQA